MGNNALRLAIRRALLIGALPAGVQTTTAVAQEEPAGPLEEVVVTGTRIVQPNMDAISPVTSISSEELRVTGEVRIEDVINQLPQVLADQGSNIANAADGTATVDLRGLGAQRTLVLINGRRTMPGDPDGGSAADLNLIPMTILQRVEVLTGGASSVYGADAVAGVVNFILDTEFEGVRIDANYSWYTHENDNSGPAADAVRAAGFPLPEDNVDVGHSRDISLALGIGGDSGHATVYATYRDVEPVLQSEFDYSACALNSGDVFTCGGSGTSASAHFLEFVNNIQVSDTVVGEDGELRPFTDADVYNFGPLNYYMRPDERYTAGVFANYSLSDIVGSDVGNAEVYGEAMFMDDRSVAQIAPSGSFFTTQQISCSNPLLSASMVEEWCTSEGLGPEDSATVLVGRRNVEGGGRQDDIGHQAYRIVGGVRGDINDTWAYDAYFQHGSSKRNSAYLRDFSITRINRALDVVTDTDPESETFGQPVCRSVIDGSDPSCVPWNIFAPGGVTPEALEYLQTPGIQRAEAIQQILHADITGELEGVRLPSAETGLALNFGVERREEETDFLPDLQFQTGDLAGQGGATVPVSGRFDVNEAFVEARLPLIEGLPAAEVVSLEAGYRYSDYSLGFDTDTYKIGLDWSPTQSIRLRGSFQRAVRAPNIGELFQPQTVLLDGTTDPCDGEPEATLEQCLLTGMTEEQYLNGVAENPAAQYNGLLGGNPELTPEEADTKTFGIIWQPDFADMSLTVDYFDIQIDDRISSVLGGNADTYIEQCIATADPTFCDLIHRDEFGSLWLSPNNAFVIDFATNTGHLGTKGIDIQFNYGLEIGEHALQFNLIGTKLDELEFELVDGAGTYDCVGFHGSTCAPGSPEWRHGLRTTWQTPWRDLGLTLAWRYIGSTDLESTSGNPQLGGEVFPTDAHFGSRSYLDLTGQMTFFDNYTVRVGINNLTDKDPPLIGQDFCPAGPCNGNTFAQTYEVLGRQWFVAMTMDF